MVALQILGGITGLLLVAACVPGAAAPPVSSTPPAAATAPSDTLSGLIEAARAEGQLTLIWTPSIGGRTGAIQRWGEGFNRMYNLNLMFHYTPGPTIPEMLARITQEMQAGRPAASDVYLGADTSFAQALQSGVLLAVDWIAWLLTSAIPRCLCQAGSVSRSPRVRPASPTTPTAYGRTRCPPPCRTSSDRSTRAAWPLRCSSARIWRR